MSISVEIEPCCDSLDMYGEPDRHSAYSLSGHIIISVSSSSSLFERKNSVRLLLQSLVVTFEGQTELVTEETGYSAVRLCSISKDLVQSQTIELNNEDMDDPTGLCEWRVVFNLTIPGWLPASAPFGDSDAGTRYTLYADATFEQISDSLPASWFSTLCSPFHAPSKAVKAHKPIQLNRYTSPSQIASTSTSVFPLTHFGVAAQADQLEKQSAFPPEVLTKLRVRVSVPECVALGEDQIPFIIRLRTDGLDASDCAKLRAISFFADIEQAEKYRAVPHPGYMSQFPVPPEAEQPPRRKLRRAHPIHGLYDPRYTKKEQDGQVLGRTLTALPDNFSGRYTIAGDGYIFKDDSCEANEKTWYSLTTAIPIYSSPELNTGDWKMNRSLRASVVSPLLSVSHRMYITLTCTYDIGVDANGAMERAVAHMRFHVPLRFVQLPPISSRPSSPASTLVGGDSRYSVDLPQPSVPYAPALPAYSQLYDTNGDRKIDYSVPLPLYTAIPADGDKKVLPAVNPYTLGPIDVGEFCPLLQGQDF